MMDDNYSRRRFLKKFAYLASGAFCLSATTLACYGPPPGERPRFTMVSDIYFRDAGGINRQLRNNNNVPLDTIFTIEFTDDMNTSVPAAVFLNDPDANEVSGSYVKKWDTVRLLTLAPSPGFYLLSNMGYTLQVGEDVEDAGGNKILLSESATATFVTVTA